MKYLALVFGLLLIAGCVSGEKERPELVQLNSLIQKGDRAYRDSNFIKAVQCYVDAILEAEELAPDCLDSIKQKLSSTYLDWARSLYWQAKQERSAMVCHKAITMAQRAAEIDPNRQIQCEVLIDKLNRDLSSIKYENATDLKNLDPLYSQRKLQIDVLCKQAKVFFDSGQYTNARDKYEEVLLLDPFNLIAIRSLKKVMKEVAEVGAKRKQLTEKERLAEVEWNYVQAIVMKEKQSQKSKSDSPSPDTLEQKLSDCIIKELNFKDMPLDKVFAAIQQEIRSALKNDFSFKFDGFSPDDKQLAPVTFEVKDIPADDAIRVICEGMKLDYKFIADGVLISLRKAL